MDEPLDNTEVSAPPAAVDGAAVLCPLCGYDLRGLMEPRCPECGYRFVWAELLDRKRNEHPYLFEHHPRHNAWSFVRTAVGALNPVRFWRTLRPQMTPRAGRLIVYWILAIALPTIPAACVFSAADAVVDRYPTVNLRNSRGFIVWQGPGNGRFVATQSAARFQLQPRNGRFVGPPPAPAWAQAIYDLGPLAAGALLASALIFSWAIISSGALFIFQQSMAKVSILPIHVKRCIGYSYNITSWLGFVVLVPVIQLVTLRHHGNDRLLCWAAAVIAVPALVRLWAAYRFYLGFDHAFWVVASSQTLAGLALVTMAFELGMVR